MILVKICLTIQTPNKLKPFSLDFDLISILKKSNEHLYSLVPIIRQSNGTPQGIEQPQITVTLQLKDTPAKVYAIGAKLIFKEVLQNLLLIQLKDTPQIFENIQGLIKELFQIIEPCLVI